MTSCQRLVPADLEANHLAKWIPPPHKRRHPFFFPFLELLPFMPTSDASLHSLIHLALEQMLILRGSCFALLVNLLYYFFENDVFYEHKGGILGDRMLLIDSCSSR